MKCPVIILCGGKGTRILEDNTMHPKPMLEVGGKPILWHIMKIYSFYGFNKFILPLGHKGEYVKNYFCNYGTMDSNNTVIINSTNTSRIRSEADKDKWEITFVDTGVNTLKGGRIKRVEPYIDTDYFHLTYGDGVANIDLLKLEEFHKQHDVIGTVTAVRPPSRFGELCIDGDKAIHFEEKPQLGTGFINGGFFIFNRSFLDYLTADEDCDLEFGALQRIARDGKLYVHKHTGFWQCMDTARDRAYLNKLWQENLPSPWQIWEMAVDEERVLGK